MIFYAGSTDFKVFSLLQYCNRSSSPPAPPSPKASPLLLPWRRRPLQQQQQPQRPQRPQHTRLPPPTCSFPGQTSYTSFEYHYTSPNLLGVLASQSAAVKETVWCLCPPGSAYARGSYRVKRPARGMMLIITTYTCKRVSEEIRSLIAGRRAILISYSPSSCLRALQALPSRRCPRCRGESLSSSARNVSVQRRKGVRLGPSCLRTFGRWEEGIWNKGFFFCYLQSNISLSFPGHHP